MSVELRLYPLRRTSIRDTLKIVRELRQSKIVRKQTIFDLEINGFDEWTILVTSDCDEVGQEVIGYAQDHPGLLEVTTV